MIKKRAFMLVISIMLISAMLIGFGTCQKAVAKDKIVIGFARAFSGVLALTGDNAFTPIAEMWLDEVNERGGIYVEEYGKKLPVEFLKYDTKSDTGTMTRLLEKLILEDEVDFIFPPVSTAHLYAAAPIANKHGYILSGMEGGSKHLQDYMEQMPYFFSNLNYCVHQMPVLADIFEEQGVEDVAIIYISDLHGVEYSESAVECFGEKGIEIVFNKSINPGAKDLSSVIKEAQAADVDAFLSFTYPDESILVTKQSIELGFNPKAFVVDVGANFEFYKNMFGADKVEGIINFGAWNTKSSPEAKEFYEKFAARYGREKVDWWGQLTYYGALELFAQAIERAGTLDQEVVRDVMANEKFETCMGTTWYENGNLSEESYTGQVGQWQDGISEVIGPKDKATSQIIYPKPEWPQ